MGAENNKIWDEIFKRQQFDDILVTIVSEIPVLLLFHTLPKTYVKMPLGNKEVFSICELVHFTKEAVKCGNASE